MAHSFDCYSIKNINELSLEMYCIHYFILKINDVCKYNIKSINF